MEEEVSAAVERTQRRTRNLAREDARILVRRDDIVGAVHDQCRRRHTGQTFNELSG